jgi:hypothetical protein
MAICDMCGSVNGIWVYPLDPIEELPITSNIIVIGLDRDWILCDHCSSYIETDDHNGLLVSLLATWKSRHESINKLPGDLLELQQKQRIEAIRAGFNMRRNGTRYLIT